MVRPVEPPGQNGAYDCLVGDSEMARRMRGFDWSPTQVGPVAGWPQSLRTAVSIMLASGYPMAIAWGPTYTWFYNDGYRPVLGSTKHPGALGKPGREVWVEIWDYVGGLFDRVVATGVEESRRDQLFLLERHGFIEECYFDFSYSPIRDESGGVGGVLVTCSETTGRVIGERRLRTLRDLAAEASEARAEADAWKGVARALAGNPQDLPFAALYRLTDGGKTAVLAASAGDERPASAFPAAVALTSDNADGWPLASVAASGRPEIVEDAPARFGVPAAAGTDGPVGAAVVQPITRPGLDHPYGLLVAGLSARRPVDENYRDFCSLVADHIATAIGNARAREEERRRAEALMEIDRAKTLFFTNISHEFRTPLTLLLGPLEDALRLPERRLAGEELDFAYRNALRLLRLVNNLLDFSRIEAGRIEATYEPTDLAALTAGLASAFRSAVARAGLRFVVDCPPLPEPIYVDHEMWEKIVLNLLSNALKFTFEGEIAVVLRHAGDHVELAVRDTGTGIPAEEIPLLFERFHRVRDARARTHEGTGIGLALVFELVKLHGGTIAVESTPGVGSVFTVSLPTGVAHLPAERIGAGRTLSSTATGAAAYVEEVLRWLPGAGATGEAEAEAAEAIRPAGLPSAPAGDAALDGPPSPALVLVADDNADMREYLVRLLGRRWRVRAAADGLAALAAAREQPPDLVLADVMMPGMDGFQLLRELRRDAATRTIPIVLLSARAGEESRVEGLEAGADDYLVKPFSARELIARVGVHLELSRVRRELVAARDRLLSDVAAERTRLYELFMQAPAVIAYLRGPEHVFEFTNPRYQQLFGHRELVGKPIREALPELDGQGFFELLDQVFTSGEPYIGDDVRARLDTGGGKLEDRYFDFVYQPLRRADGAVEGVLVHAVDVTERVRTRQEKEQFLSAVSHDLKNPLTAIKGMGQLLRRRVARLPEAEQQSFIGLVQEIDRTCDRLTGLLDQLLDLTRPQWGQSLVLDRRPTDLVELAQRLTRRHQESTERHELVLQTPQAPVVGDWDTDRLERVVGNLLSNALKYSPDGGPVLIEVAVEDTGDRRRAVLTVRDHGVGIPAADLPHVFERFYRGSNVTGLIGGTGIGLAGVKQIVEQHDGSIAIESLEGAGTTVSVRLPLA